MVYTVRLASRRAAADATPSKPSSPHSAVVQKNSRPNHPTTCGKVERFQQTLKNWLHRPGPPAGHHDRACRPCSTGSATSTTPSDPTAPCPPAHPRRRLHHPTQSRTRANPRHGPTTGSAATGSTTGKVTLRHAGTLYSIGIGRSHNGTPVLVLVHGQDITIIDATTGELLRELTLDTTRKYQPQNAKQGEP